MIVRTMRRRTLSAAVLLLTATSLVPAFEGPPQDERAARSRRVLSQALSWEQEIAAAIRTKNRAALMSIAADIDRVIDARSVPTHCDAALLTMASVEREIGSGGRLRVDEVAGDGFQVQTIATSLGHCEDDAGMRRSERLLTAGFFKSY